MKRDSVFCGQGVLALRVVALVLCGAVFPVAAEVSLPDLFTDHALVQRDAATAIWGRATPGERVSVDLAGAAAEATTGADGWWIAKLDTRKLGEGPFELKVVGKTNTVVSKDILVGEVWLAGGQSNMEFKMKSGFGPVMDFDRRRAACKGRPLRVFRAPRRTDSDPFKGDGPIAWDVKGKWNVVSPFNLWSLTAVGYCFIDTLQKSIGGPVAVVDISWSGTRCWAWMPRERIDAHPELKKEFDRQAALIAKGEVKKVNKPVIRCWNNQFYPVSQMACRGIIWYQGCCDSGLPDGTHTYPAWLSYMVADMRHAMGRPDLPFLYCQLSGWGSQTQDPSADVSRAKLREGQRRAQKLISNSAMAVILDNSEYEIHNRMKGPAGDRLAALALRRVYGRKDVTCYSPDFREATFDGEAAMVKFDIDGSPLKVGPFRETLMWNVHSNDVIKVVRHASAGCPLEGFTLRDGQGKWHWADAQIVGPDTVRVWAKEVKNPTVVRYNWGNQGFGNLYNEAGLPASCFTSEE